MGTVIWISVGVAFALIFFLPFLTKKRNEEVEALKGPILRLFVFGSRLRASDVSIRLEAAGGGRKPTSDVMVVRALDQLVKEKKLTKMNFQRKGATGGKDIRYFLP